MDRFVVAAEVTGAGVTTLAGDIIQGQVGPTEQILGLFQPDAAEEFFRAGLAHLGEEPAQMARRDVEDLGHLFH